MEAIKSWFKFIKTYDGKKANSIHYNEEVFNADKASEVIAHTHAMWKQLKDINTKADSKEI